MPINIKNIVITILLVAVTIPFILVTDLFPFMRFGMFAEPVKSNVQKEIFVLSYNESGNEKEFDPTTIGIEPHFFFYLLRNHYYRGESEKFITQVEQLTENKNIHQWTLKRIIVSDKKSLSSDTSIVFQK